MTIGILSTEFYLLDQWPGEVTDGNNPSDWTTTYATDVWDLGTKRMVYDDTNKGWATLMFLKFEDETVAEPTLAGYPMCGMQTAAAASGHYYTVSNDASEIDLLGPIAIALGAVTTAKPYGWFWVGGVCPENAIPALNDQAFKTINDVTAQKYMILGTSSSYAAFALGAATDFAMFAAYSLVQDANS